MQHNERDSMLLLLFALTSTAINIIAVSMVHNLSITVIPFKFPASTLPLSPSCSLSGYAIYCSFGRRFTLTPRTPFTPFPIY